eukprot:TRINITY_DN1913_c0_g1_i1.p1 TRINITY_DN1913_c0_g1~~TRINITY_DN1913_c0_g1_i1.p1  ORF type:complete len:371 (-),score=62.03 TRINITY_DN1913_c0_g1_i1:83-1195(-)
MEGRVPPDLSFVLRTLQEYEESLKARSRELDLREASVDSIIAAKEQNLLASFESRDAELTRRELAFEEKMTQWEKSKGDLKVLFGPVVKLNVGGQIFTTTTQTLCKAPGGMLASMFSGRFQIPVDDTGAVFIDRDPKHFNLILNFLRDGSVPTISDPRDRQEISREADFYGLDGLLDRVDEGPFATASSYADNNASDTSDRDEVDLTIPLGLTVADFTYRYPRGYEIATKKAVCIQGVKLKCNLTEGTEGWVRLYSAGDCKQLAEGSFFVGIGKKAWLKSTMAFKLATQKKYLLLVFCNSQAGGADKCYLTTMPSTTTKAREVGPFSVAAISVENRTGERIQPFPSTSNIALKIILDNGSSPPSTYSIFN